MILATFKKICWFLSTGCAEASKFSILYYSLLLVDGIFIKVEVFIFMKN